MTNATRSRTTAGALTAWFGTRLGLVLLTAAAGYQLRGSHDLLSGWDSWDATSFRKIAQFGYSGYPHHYVDRDLRAYFPGFPVVLAGAHVLVPNWTAAGLLVSLVAGAVAVVALSRLAVLDGADGGRATLYLVLSPYAVFLAAGYSESLFLAFALPGWLCARRGQWPAASLLVAGAALCRVNGAFLAVGLVVLWATGSRDRSAAPWLLAPFAALFGYAAYLHHLTGDWLAWQHAQADGWGRHLTAPWTALRVTYDYSRQPYLSGQYRWELTGEMVAVAIGVVVTLVLLARRSWGEATYVGLSVASLATSTYYLSVTRATLLWFPLWVLLAQVTARRAWLHTTYVAVSAPLMLVGVLTFTAGRWTG